MAFGRDKRFHALQSRTCVIYLVDNQDSSSEQTAMGEILAELRVSDFIMLVDA